MALHPEKLLNWPFVDVVHRYDDRDTMLYALSVGLGGDPLDRRQLRFTFEKDLRAVPTMAMVLGMTDLGFLTDVEVGIDMARLLHGESELEIHGSLPASGAIVSRMRIVDLVDKGPQKGAFLYYERRIRDAADDTPLATDRGCFILRGNGGFSGAVGTTPAPHAIPDRPADLVCDLRSLPQAALIYRLNGDRNPLHADPGLARKAGFDRPILHGACTFAIAGHALLKSICEYDPARLRSIGARFSSPVFPGETLRTEIWLGDGGQVSFRCRVPERDRIVLDNGHAGYRAADRQRIADRTKVDA